MLSLYLWTPKWRLCATWSAIFFDEGLYSKWVCMQLYILIIKYLNLKKQKKKLKMKQIIKFIWSWRFVVFNPACLKKDQLDFRNLTDLCVCVCVWAFVWAWKRETEREQKRINSIFKREREKKRKKSFNSIFNKREKKLISLHWKTYFPTLKKLISPLCENLFPCKHKYPTDGTALEHIKLF